ncbi:hypothetical protein ACS0TY_028637 [Phlomoides rotata]
MAYKIIYFLQDGGDTFQILWKFTIAIQNCVLKTLSSCNSPPTTRESWRCTPTSRRCHPYILLRPNVTSWRRKDDKLRAKLEVSSSKLAIMWFRLFEDILVSNSLYSPRRAESTVEKLCQHGLSEQA